MGIIASCVLGTIRLFQAVADESAVFGTRLWFNTGGSPIQAQVS